MPAPSAQWRVDSQSTVLAHRTPIRAMTRWHTLPLLALLWLAGLQDAVIARSAAGDRVLVVLEHALAKSQYSAFWSSLQGGSGEGARVHAAG